jgi:hypothetical protein
MEILNFGGRAFYGKTKTNEGQNTKAQVQVNKKII